MVKDMRYQTSFIVSGLGRSLSNEGRASMLIGEMEVFSLKVFVQEV